MSFQAYLDNIQAKTGIDAAGFRALAAQKGFIQNGALKPEAKAAAVIAWLKADYALGHGHGMAIFALLKGKKKEEVTK
jgi:Domain of unknown function (DUF4287)